MAQFKIEWSQKAKLDLKNILDFYISRNKSYTYSKKLNSEIHQKINYLLENPLLGINSDFESVKILIIGNYQIVYEIMEHLIVIVMVWDSRRNPDDFLIQARIQ